MSALRTIAHLFRPDELRALENQYQTLINSNNGYCVFTFPCANGSLNVCFGFEMTSNALRHIKPHKAAGVSVRYFQVMGHHEVFAVLDDQHTMYYSSRGQHWALHEQSQILSISTNMQTQFLKGVLKVTLHQPELAPELSALQRVIRWGKLQKEIELSVTSLIIENNFKINGSVTQAEVKVIKDLIRTTNLHSFELNNGLIGDQGCCEIVTALQTSTCVHVDLTNNAIGKIGCTALSQMLESNTSIQSLDLSGNHQIGSTGCVQIVEALKWRFRGRDQPTYIKINLMNCGIEAEGLVSVLELMKQYDFVHFDLRFNAFPHYFKTLDLQAKCLEIGKRLKSSVPAAPKDESKIESMIGSRVSGVVLGEKKDLDSLGNPIATGTSAVVYDLGDGSAMKVLYPQKRAKAMQITRELEIWRELNHANIVPFWSLVSHDLYLSNQDEVSVAFIMSKMDKTLRQYLDQNIHNDNGLSRCTLLSILHQIAKALEYTHNKKIIHRDMHSNNIFVNDSKGTPQVALGDFGLSCPLGSKLEEDMIQNTLSSGGARLIRPPECRSEDSSHLTLVYDIFTFGILIWEVLANKRIPAETVLAQEHKMTIEEWILYESSGEGYAGFRRDSTYALMKKCLHPDPLQRPTAVMVQNDIKQALDTLEFHQTLLDIARSNGIPEAKELRDETSIPEKLESLRKKLKNCTFTYVSDKVQNQIAAFGIETTWEWVQKNSKENRTSGGLELPGARYFWTVGPGPELFAVAGSNVFYHHNNKWIKYNTAFILNIT
jgi:serine/threonine protein kinase